MRSTWLAALGVLLAAACSGDPPKAMCDGEIYDPCFTEHDCLNMVCMPFDNAFEACTMTCTSDSDCPKQDGKTVTCNASMLCQPDAPNACPTP